MRNVEEQQGVWKLVEPDDGKTALAQLWATCLSAAVAFRDPRPSLAGGPQFTAMDIEVRADTWFRLALARGEVAAIEQNNSRESAHIESEPDDSPMPF